MVRFRFNHSEVRCDGGRMFSSILSRSLVLVCVIAFVLSPGAAEAGSIYPIGSSATPSPDGTGVDLAALGGTTVASHRKASSTRRSSPVTCAEAPLASLHDPS